ncbi:MAG: hypothetical protein LAT66_02765 [Alkalimonas sp.]|nr:hypothetical protein [Alkalimonas sp.]
MKTLLLSLGLLSITAIAVLVISSQMPMISYGLQLWLLTPILISAALSIALQRKGKLKRLFPIAAVIITALALLPYLGMQTAESQGERAILLLVMVPLYQGIALLLVGLIDYVRRREAQKKAVRES